MKYQVAFCFSNNDTEVLEFEPEEYLEAQLVIAVLKMLDPDWQSVSTRYAEDYTQLPLEGF